MRALSQSEEVLLTRHLALTRARDRYLLYRQYQASALALDELIIDAIEGLHKRQQRDLDVLYVLLSAKAGRVRNAPSADALALVFSKMQTRNFQILVAELAS